LCIILAQQKMKRIAQAWLLWALHAVTRDKALHGHEGKPRYPYWNGETLILLSSTSTFTQRLSSQHVKGNLYSGATANQGILVSNPNVYVNY
jgi:hypothetical protein